MQTQTRRLLPVLGAVGVGVCLCVAAIVTLGAQRPRSIGLESSSAEHAAENSFFDSLAARDLAKDRKSRNAKDALGSHKALSASQARTLANSYFKHVGEAPVGHQATAHAGARKVPAKHWKPLPASALVHFSKFKGMHKTGGAAKPAVGKKGHGIASMRAEFAKAQEQLKQEKSKMRHMEEKDKVRAAEQHIDLEHLKAQQQARAYERHLTKLNDAVFPRSMEDSVVGKHSHAVSHALVDDMHVPKITKADYERHPMMKAAHGSNKLYRRVRNSGRDFAKQVLTGRAVSHSHLKSAKPMQLHAKASVPAK
jgi:hypothetical protein